MKYPDSLICKWTLFIDIVMCPLFLTFLRQSCGSGKLDLISTMHGDVCHTQCSIDVGGIVQNKS